LAFIPQELQSAPSQAVIPIAEASIVIEEKIPEDIPEKVDYYADKYKVDRDLAHYIAKNESQYNPKAIGDMSITCKRTGSPVRARGVYQITECFYPEISDAEAFDADSNIKIAMQIIAKGKSTCMSQFTTCRNYYSK